MTFEFEAIIRILIALVCGGIIGYEREYKNRPAGLRTHMLVCIGAALVMIVSQLLFKYMGSTDPARLGAQVISGIGFLGAGTIIRDRFNVKGLTTAATLWVVACIGLAIGSGYWLLGVIVTAIIFFTLIIFRKFERIMKIKHNKAVLKITSDYMDNVYENIEKLLEKEGFLITSSKFAKYKKNENVDITFSLTCDDHKKWDSIVSKLYRTDGILKVDIEF